MGFGVVAVLGQDLAGARFNRQLVRRILLVDLHLPVSVIEGNLGEGAIAHLFKLLNDLHNRLGVGRCLIGADEREWQVIQTVAKNAIASGNVLLPVDEEDSGPWAGSILPMNRSTSRCGSMTAGQPWRRSSANRSIDD